MNVFQESQIQEQFLFVDAGWHLGVSGLKHSVTS